jgi:hypothetical protein
MLLFFFKILISFLNPENFIAEIIVGAFHPGVTGK